MLTPDKGDYSGITLTPAGRALADKWDPAQDEASGNQCKSYGAPAIMRVPTRLHIQWQGDNELRIDTDAGKQTRVLHFNAKPPASAAPSLQGYSVATWEGLRARGTGGVATTLGEQAEGASAGIYEGRDDAVEARVPAQERRALRRGYPAHGVFRRLQGA